MTRDDILAAFSAHPRIRVVRIADGFSSNTSLFKYARDLGRPRGDMYEIAVFEETLALSRREVMFAINIPQEAVVVPETIDGVRAALRTQEDRLEAVGATNRYLGLRAQAEARR
jgi:glyceraldehyde-3-phosphate dehydrogenase (NAD(P))